jgi:hypothetical protein
MAKQLTIDDAKESLNAHVERKGRELFEKYGPRIGWNEIQQILQDRAFVRYPCEIIFSADVLQEGEFAHPVPIQSDCPDAGFKMYVHPYFSIQLQRVPYLVLYQLVLVNYGDFVSAEDAEIFGSSALGISKEEYYKILCEISDEISGA